MYILDSTDALVGAWPVVCQSLKPQNARFAKTGLEEKAAGDAVEALMKTWQTWEPKTHLKGSSRRHAIHSYLRATRWCLLADQEPVLGQLNSQP